MKDRTSIYRITAIGLMTAIVFVSNYIQFGIDTPLGPTRIHIANGICLLAALLFGELGGGIAAGLGSFLYDLTNPAYAATSWVTFLMKFLLAYICGIIIYAKYRQSTTSTPGLFRRILGTTIGSLSYVVMYVLKQYIEQCLILGYAVETVMFTTLTVKLPVSLINAAIAIPVSILIYHAVSPALKNSGLSDKMQIR
ncbi:MAG: ECF transporter S component [Oscillospiraceae bacterium]|nr:ECF transporter S component [Oscillospiraceae bacterium]